MASGEKTRVGEGGALVPYSARTAAGSTMRDPKGAAGYYKQQLGQGGLFPRGQLLGGALSALPTAGLVAADLAQGRTLDAAGTAVGGGLTLAATEAIGRGVGGKYGAAIRGVGAIAAPFVGNVLGNTLEGKKAEDAGVAPAAASEVEERKAGRARTKQNAQDFLDMNINAMSAYAQQNIDLLKAASDQEYLNNQRNAPMVKKYLDEQMVRQQSLNASIASNYAMLGTVATAGKLATGAQEQTGATMRTMLSNNPYSGSVMQAPNISFG